MHVFRAIVCCFFTVLALAWVAKGAVAAEDTPAPVSSARELLALYGFDESYFEKLPQGTGFDENQTEPLLRGLFALRRFTRMDLDRWKQPSRALTSWLDAPADHAGELIEVRGRVRRVTRVRPAAEVARRFDLPVYYRCDLLLTSPPTPATVFALSIPTVWLEDKTETHDCDERVAFNGLFLKTQAAVADSPAPLFLAQRVGWLPEQGNYATLGNLGVDAGLMDGVRDKTPLAESSDLEREAFYQWLDAAKRTAPGELHAVATTEVRNARKIWEIELSALRQNAARPTDRSEDLQRKLDRASDDADDVVPLFNAPDHVRGRLCTVVGTVRRAIEIKVEDADIRERFGLERYYEVELVTPDSRSNPLAFCVRELPPKFPLGENLHEPARATGFFLKTWAFRTPESADAAPGTLRKQLAPLLIGRDLEWNTPPVQAETPRVWLYAGIVFAAVFAIVVACWLMRDVKSRRRELPERI